MSTAQLVPETWELDGDDAADVLKEARFHRLLVDSVERFRTADGTTHARSLAFATLLTVLPGTIAVVGVATGAGVESFSDAINDLLDGIAPGESGNLLADALRQGATTTRHGAVPIVFGLIAMLISGATMFGQVERGCNRIYGIESDRPLREKYVMSVTMFALCFAVVTVGFVLFGLVPGAHLLGPTWVRVIVRTAIAMLLAAVSFAFIFQRCPRRHQPKVSWLVVGSLVSTVLWGVATAGLALFWRLGDTFGKTYGPLAGVMAFALWCYLIALGLYLGVSFAAQLEAVRAGRAAPEDVRKVVQSEPDKPVTSPSPGDPILPRPSSAPA